MGASKKETRKRELNRRLRELRAEWKEWSTPTLGGLSHIDYCLAPCADECGRCEGCVSADYRAGKRQEIKAVGELVKAALEAA